MIITGSTLALTAQHSAVSRNQVSETMRAWVGNARPDFAAMEQGSVTSLSAAALAAAKAATATPAAATANPSSASNGSSGSSELQAMQGGADAVSNDPHLNLIRLMVEMLTGHKIRLFSASDLSAQASPAPPAPTDAQAAQPVQAPQRAGFGIEYDRHELHTESEQTTFQASGTIRTADGKDIAFKLDLAMSRSYSAETDTSLRAGDGVKKDPLVINFGGTAAQLQSQRFSFDLTGSGELSKVPLLAGGSGFLALDANGNGKIDSGKELFGPKSGNGFADLARYDSDGNGWIDEKDPVFSKLLVWTPAAAGGGSLATLKEKGVGALSLAKTATPFEIKDGANQSLGTVRESGVYLSENGTAGSLQQVDLTV